MEKEDPLRKKSMDFAVRIVGLSRWLREEKKEFAIADQVLRSGTSIGANLAEAKYASSKKDFVNKCRISLKESSEALFWIELLVKSGLATREQVKAVYSECNSLRRMLSATCITIEKGLSMP